MLRRRFPPLAGPLPQYRVARFSVSLNNPSGAQERGPDVGGAPSQAVLCSPRSTALPEATAAVDTGWKCEGLALIVQLDRCNVLWCHKISHDL